MNIVAAGGISTSGVVNEITQALLEFRDIILKMRSTNDMIAKSFLIVDKLFEYYERKIAVSYRNQWKSFLGFCANDIPQLLIDLLSDNRSSQEKGYPSSGLSPVGIVWTASSLCKSVLGRFLTFGPIFVMSENIKLISDLISDTYLEHLKCWNGIGGGVNGVRDMINAVIDLLLFPISVGPNAVYDDRVSERENDIAKANMWKYMELLAEIGVPVTILHCLEYMDLEDVAKAVTCLAKMTCHQIFANQLLHIDLLGPSRVGKCLNVSCPGEVTSEMLMIVSNIAYMSEEFYEELDGANMLENLKDFLTHKDSIVRANTCKAIGNMCRHSSYFYTHLAKHHIIRVLIERCADPDELTRGNACFAIGYAAYHSDQLYEELRDSIPQLVKLSLSTEGQFDIKTNAAGALDNLVRNSDELHEDILREKASFVV